MSLWPVWRGKFITATNNSILLYKSTNEYCIKIDLMIDDTDKPYCKKK